MHCPTSEAELQSASALAIFAANHAGLKINMPTFDPFLFKQTVNAVVRAINELEGFKVCRWNKPSKQDGDVCAEPQSSRN